MPNPAHPVMAKLAACLALAAPALAATDAPARAQVTSVTIRERIVVRVPRIGTAPAPVTWKEKGGPKCIRPAELAGALIAVPGAVDFVMQGGKRMRARLDGECQALAFYSGFYIRPAADGKVCADRDAIRARSGASCQIDAFRALKPVAAKR